MTAQTQFLLATEASAPESRTTVCNVKNIQLCEDGALIYAFLIEKQVLGTSHTSLVLNPTIKAAVRSMKTQGQRRHVKISMTGDLWKTYVDDDGNVTFDGEFLDEDAPPAPRQLQKSLPTQPESVSDKKKSLQSIGKDMVLEKYTGKGQNAKSWINTFEIECTQMEITENQRCDALRLFLEGASTDWYAAMRKLIGAATWLEWKT